MPRDELHHQAAEAARGLDRGPRWSAWRLVLDLALVVALAAVSERVGSAWLTAAVILAIGAFPLHDVLVHGHEAIHGLASRRRAVNAAILFLTHALVGISGRAHRAFHLDHHRSLGTAEDPERRVHGDGGPILGPLRVLLLSHALVNGHAWRRPHTRIDPRSVLADLVGAAALHGLILAGVGPRLWMLYLVLPASTGLPVVAAARALTEHLAPRASDWVVTRAMSARRLGQLAWSNVDHHVEHHLCPQVPWHRLPELRRRLGPLYAASGVEIDHGLFRTAFRIVVDRSADPG